MNLVMIEMNEPRNLWSRAKMISIGAGPHFFMCYVGDCYIEGENGFVGPVE